MWTPDDMKFKIARRVIEERFEEFNPSRDFPVGCYVWITLEEIAHLDECNGVKRDDVKVALPGGRFPEQVLQRVGAA